MVALRFTDASINSRIVLVLVPAPKREFLLLQLYPLAATTFFLQVSFCHFTKSHYLYYCKNHPSHTGMTIVTLFLLFGRIG